MFVGVLMIAGGAAGLFGSLLGLGGGILLVPILTLGFDLPLRAAVGVSLVAVMMTSSAAAGVYLEKHVADLRLGMSLELWSALGALVGGSVAFLLDEQVLEVMFGILLILVAISMVRGRARKDRATETDVAEPGSYEVHNMPLGIAGSAGAGVASALLGVGGGIIKVPLMHVGMGVPLRVSTATSNLMVGITAAASAVIYLSRGRSTRTSPARRPSGSSSGRASARGSPTGSTSATCGPCSSSCCSTRRSRC